MKRRLIEQQREYESKYFRWSNTLAQKITYSFLLFLTSAKLFKLALYAAYYSGDIAYTSAGGCYSGAPPSILFVKLNYNLLIEYFYFET